MTVLKLRELQHTIIGAGRRDHWVGEWRTEREALSAKRRYRSLGVATVIQRDSSDPKLYAFSRFASAKASSSEYRNVPGFLLTQRSPDGRDAKKKMK